MQDDSNQEVTYDMDYDVEDMSISAVLVGLRSKGLLFSMQQHFNNFEHEPLTAIMPGTLMQLWDIIKVLEDAFNLTTLIIVFIALLGLLLALFMSINQQQREISILRMLGAHQVMS